jgi:hypothetical protein
MRPRSAYYGTPTRHHLRDAGREALVALRGDPVTQLLRAGVDPAEPDELAEVARGLQRATAQRTGIGQTGGLARAPYADPASFALQVGHLALSGRRPLTIT